MNTIKLNIAQRKEIEAEHVKKIKRMLVHGNVTREKEITKRYDEICKKLDVELKKIGVQMKFKDLIVADFDKLKKIAEELKMKNLDFGSYSKQNINGKPFEKVYKAYDKLIKYNYNTLLAQELEVYVCPYCNRDYINIRGDKGTLQLDHFYPRSKFPIFAVALYNLIPSCYACNHIKSDNGLAVSPYENYCIDDLLTFSFSINDIDFVTEQDSLDVVLKVLYSEFQNISENIEVLKLNQAYSLHKNEIQSVLKKAIVFSEKKIDELYYEYRDIFASKEELVKEIFGRVNKGDYLNNPLSKLRSDIFKEIYD